MAIRFIPLQSPEPRPYYSGNVRDIFAKLKQVAGSAFLLPLQTQRF